MSHIDVSACVCVCVCVCEGYMGIRVPTFTVCGVCVCPYHRAAFKMSPSNFRSTEVRRKNNKGQEKHRSEKSSAPPPPPRRRRHAAATGLSGVSVPGWRTLTSCQSSVCAKTISVSPIARQSKSNLKNGTCFDA